MRFAAINLLFALVVSIAAMCVVAAPAAGPAPVLVSPAQGTSFTTIDVFLDAAEPLAAYQFELTLPGGAKIVGIEGGEHAAYQQPPYYDPAAMMNERVIAAAFSTAGAAALPSGRTRIATIHVQLPAGAKVDPAVKLTVAATVEGRRIPAEITLVQGTLR